MKKLINYISKKFYVGMGLILLSFILGGVAKVVFIIYFYSNFMRWFSIILYILSFPILVVGIWLAGREYYEAMKKYFSYKYYTKSAYNKTKAIREKVKGKFKRRDNK